MNVKDKIKNYVDQRLSGMSDEQVEKGLILFYVSDNYINDEIKSMLNDFNSKLLSKVSDSVKSYNEQQKAKEQNKAENQKSSKNLSDLESFLLNYKNDILSLRKTGQSYNAIAEKYDVSRTTITKFIKKYQ